MSVVRIIDISDPPFDADVRHERLVEKARPLFAHEHPMVVGSALGELVAIWLAGHQVERARHEELLDLHTKTVRDLLPLAEAEINDLLKQRSGGLS